MELCTPRICLSFHTFRKPSLKTKKELLKLKNLSVRNTAGFFILKGLHEKLRILLWLEFDKSVVQE